MIDNATNNIDTSGSSSPDSQGNSKLKKKERKNKGKKESAAAEGGEKGKQQQQQQQQQGEKPKQKGKKKQQKEKRKEKEQQQQQQQQQQQGEKAVKEEKDEGAKQNTEEEKPPQKAKTAKKTSKAKRAKKQKKQLTLTALHSSLNPNAKPFVSSIFPEKDHSGKPVILWGQKPFVDLPTSSEDLTYRQRQHRNINRNNVLQGSLPAILQLIEDLKLDQSGLLSIRISTTRFSFVSLDLSILPEIMELFMETFITANCRNINTLCICRTQGRHGFYYRNGSDGSEL